MLIYFIQSSFLSLHPCCMPSTAGSSAGLPPLQHLRKSLQKASRCPQSRELGTQLSLQPLWVTAQHRAEHQEKPASLWKPIRGAAQSEQLVCKGPRLISPRVHALRPDLRAMNLLRKSRSRSDTWPRVEAVVGSGRGVAVPSCRHTLTGAQGLRRGREQLHAAGSVLGSTVTPPCCHCPPGHTLILITAHEPSA